MGQKNGQFLPDTTYEGKNQSFLDIDRMVNEGLAGGTVSMRKDYVNIEQSADFSPEEPPENNESMP